MNSKETILARIRNGLADIRQEGAASVDRPEVPEVWPIEDLSQGDLLRMFTNSLSAVAGESTIVNFPGQTISAVEHYLVENGLQRIAVVDKPVVRQVVRQLEPLHPELQFFFNTELAEEDDLSAKELIQNVDASIISAEALLADTGSCLVANRTAFERLCCYLSPVCIVLAQRDTIYQNMPQLWPVFKSFAQSATEGEFVFITGPSRTADIEKILVLGVHGPKKLFVVIQP